MTGYRNRRRARLNQTLAQSVEVCEARQMLSVASAPINGVGNNVLRPTLGSVEIELLRIANSQYGDGNMSPAGQNRPTARFISNQIVAQDRSILNDRNLTDFVWIWGQFLDHDMDLSNAASPKEAFNIGVPTGDIHFDPQNSGTATIGLDRSKYVTGVNSSDGRRQQINSLTAFIDGSAVYGSDLLRANELRSFQGGRLKTSAGNLLPFNVNGFENAGGTSSSMFIAGDVRANENIALSSMHTLWIREHNRVVDLLAFKNPTWNDQQLYEQGRAIVAAEIQAITYNEFLPALLGSSSIAAYSGYNSSVNPGISNEFSTAAFRFGHSLLSPELRRTDSTGSAIAQDPIALKDAFFNPAALIATGIEPLLRGAATQLAQELDVHVIDAVRNFLFGQPGQGGLDLPSLNIQRGRDHGLADYNTTRIALGLAPVTLFSQITSDAAVAAAMEITYGSVNNIDLWVAGIAEDHLPGSSMGATFTRILVDQFQRLRDGDRFWYENIFTGTQLTELRNTRLSEVINRNAELCAVQTNVFFAPGTEIVDFRFADSGVRKATVRYNNGAIEIINDANGRVIFSRSSFDLAGLRIFGNPLLADRLTVEGSVTPAMLPNGIKFFPGTVGKNSLVVRGTSGNDAIVIAQQDIRLNGLNIYFENTDEILLEGGDGDDRLTVNNWCSGMVTLDGGPGNDILTGGAGADRLFGGDGHDILFGGGGDDELYGGADNDQLFGDGEIDFLDGGAGFDLLVQDDASYSSAVASRLAAFLDRFYSLTLTASDFRNWGGRNERWFYSNVGWMFITPNGSIYRWDNRPGANGVLITTIDVGCYTNLGSLCNTPGQFADEDKPTSMNDLATRQDRSLNLRFTGNFFQNWGGRNEKWILGQQGWYFITPDGRLYKWDGLPGAEGQLVSELNSTFHTRPELLYSAG